MAGNLISNANSVSVNEVNSILQDFLKRVVFVPGSHVSQDRQVIDAKLALSFLFTNNEDKGETPTIVNLALQEQCNYDLNQSLNSIDKVNIQIRNLTDGQKPATVDLLICNTDSALTYYPLLSTDFSFNDEQQVVMVSLMNSVDKFSSSSSKRL